MASHALKVLVADDQECLRVLFNRVLRYMGYACELAADGRDCLLKLSQHDYDVLFLDLVMPGIDGETVLRWVKTQTPNVHVIVTSIQDDEGIIGRMLRLGASAYLVKPFAAQQVQDVMRSIENRRTKDGLCLAAMTA